MNDGIKYIEIGFENIESIVIPIENIISFDYGELKLLTDEIFENHSYQSKHINLKIRYSNPSELKYNPMDYIEPLGMFIGNPTSNNVKDRPNILGRILVANDIVDVSLLDSNETRLKNIYVPWSDNEYNNELMKVKIKDDYLEIDIKE